MKHPPQYYRLFEPRQTFFCNGNCDERLTWCNNKDLSFDVESGIWRHNDYPEEAQLIPEDEVLFIKLTGRLPDEVLQ